MAGQRRGRGEQGAGQRPRLVRGWALAVEIATVVAGVVALLAYALPRGPSHDATTGAGTTAPLGPPSSPPAGPQSTQPAVPGLPLTELTPTEGASYLSRTGTGSTLAVRCPGLDEPSRTVVYDIRGQYRRLVAQVRVTGAPEPPATSALEVLADDVRTGVVSIVGDGSRPLSADLTVPDPQAADPAPAQRLSLRITCRLVGPTVTLIDPRLEP
jgi:hypothetical protein